MAEWPRTVEQGGDVIQEMSRAKGDNGMRRMVREKDEIVVIGRDDNGNDDIDYGYENSGDSVKLFEDLCRKGASDEGIIASTMRLLPCEDDCRKKRRCVDRYDSSESSDSGVAVLSCTDCSGSSTASSDITDPGSPFSTASSHSEDSGSQPAKMPPTQTAHHPPWPWASAAPVQEDVVVVVSNKRPLQNKPTTNTIVSKRLKSDKRAAASASASKGFVKLLPSEDVDGGHNNNICKAPKMQQGKITEYFRSQCKSNMIKKDMFKLNDNASSNCNGGSSNKSSSRPALGKFVSLVDQQTQFNSLKAQQCIISRSKDTKSSSTASKKSVQLKVKKPSPSIAPRKILPAPSTTDKMTIDEQLNSIASFAPTVTLTALSFPPNYAYLHQQQQQQQQQHRQKTTTSTSQNKQQQADTPPIFVPQFATIANDKIPIPAILNRSPCLNVLQPVQKIATINNFNCVKLNATVVPIVKVNALPSRMNGSPNMGMIPAAASSVAQQTTPKMIVETAVPTVIVAKPRNLSDLSNFTPPPKQHCNTNSNVNSRSSNSSCSVSNTPTAASAAVAGTLQNVVVHTSSQCRMETSSRTEEPHRKEEILILEHFRGVHGRSSSSSPSSTTPSVDSDSGISNSRECLEVSVCETEQQIVEQQKSPILTQPKTIRFPARQLDRKEEVKPTTQQSLDGRCRWAECNSRFDTSGALLEHLQIKHVISQTTQEHFVCLWLGCKVHGRTSCSRSWLERHVLAHAGTKPFRCIVDGCGQRFNSQLMLERHVNGHFNSDGSPNNSSAKKTTDNNASKLYKRNGKRIRFRRQPWSARMFDFFDSGIMEGLQHNLLLLTQKRTLGQISAPGDTVHLQSQILARRTETDGNVKFLLRWYPQDIVPDEWVSEKDYKPTKSTSIPSLTASSKTALNPSLFSIPPNGDHHQLRQKHRRKPIIVKQT